MDASLIRIGSRVRVRFRDGEAEFNIVADADADATAHRVSDKSPIARALLGRRPGDDVQFRAPDGVLRVTVLSTSEPDRAASQP
jgi:transcription elongation factor GreA